MSRLKTIGDTSGTLAEYKYLGLGQIVEEANPAAKLTYLTGNNVTGLDRFGRVVDQIWENYDATPTVFDHHLSAPISPDSPLKLGHPLRYNPSWS